MTPQVTFTAPIEGAKFAVSGNPETPGDITVRGLAAVFNQPSHDLGGFRTVLDPKAFDKVLAMPFDAHLVWDHDTRYTLARTTNGTLELQKIEGGIGFFARMAPTSYAKDLQLLMERGDVDQCSFACLIGEDEWASDEDGNITRTLFSLDEVTDVTICAQGAFPQTSASLVAAYGRSPQDELSAALEAGRVLGPNGEPIIFSRPDGDAASTVEPETAGGQDVEPEVAGDRSDTRLRLARLRVRAQQA